MTLPLKNAENKPIDYKAIYGVDIGDVYYKYETVGKVYWGMKKFIVSKLGTGCMCGTPFYVEFELIDNYGEKSIAHVSSEDLKKYSLTEIDAWKKYYECCSKEIQRHYKVIDTYKQSQVEAIQKITELEAKEEI